MASGAGMQVKVLGATLQGFAQACVDLNIVAGSGAIRLLEDIDILGWYPFSHLREIEDLVVRSYENVGPILERVGMEMMATWYRQGPGRDIIRSGVDFLHFQTGSQGYASVVKGPKKLVGSFDLRELDLKRRQAIIHSTTPFNKDLERGVIIGGMSAPGDLDLVAVDNQEDPGIFRMEF